jgi:hypothetical protein
MAGLGRYRELRFIGLGIEIGKSDSRRNWLLGGGGSESREVLWCWRIVAEHQQGCDYRTEKLNAGVCEGVCKKCNGDTDVLCKRESDDAGAVNDEGTAT